MDIFVRRVALGLIWSVVTLAAGLAHAQSSYPNRPVRLVAPFAPGGPVDVVARLLAPKLSEGLGQQFYVENHPGASGNIGTALVAKAPADGYTVLVISSTLVVNPSLFEKLGFDTEKDLAPISLVGVSPQILLVHPAVQAINLKELIAWVKASPGRHSYAHAGLGTPGYLAGEMLKQAFGLDLVAVSFNGGGPAITSTIGGHTPILSLAGAARRSDVGGIGRGRSGVRHHRRPARAGRNAAGDRRAPQSGDRQGGGDARRARAACGARLRADREHAPGLRRADPMGDRQVGQGHPRGRHQGAVSSV